MKYIDWSPEKSAELLQKRGVSFDFCATKIVREDVVDILENNPRYPHQKVFILNIDNYIYAVPFVEKEDHIFLKTIYPSRKLTRKYIKQ